MIPHIPDQRKFKSNASKPFNDLVAYIEGEKEQEQEDGKERKESPQRELSSQFDDILNYATAKQDKKNNEEKCIAIRTHGVHRLSTASAEMNATAKQNTRCEDPAYHVILSWPEHERPAPEAIFDAAEHALKALGLAEHQYVLAIHGNTDNMHCHISVNRVHPVTFQARHIEWAKKTLHMAARQSEIKHGWTHDNGIYVVEIDGHGKKHIVLNKDHAGAEKTKPHAHRDLGAEEILPAWHDPDSLDSWLKSKVSRDLKRALPGLADWHALHAWLGNRDITLTDSGGGGMRLHATSQATGEIVDIAASKGLRILKRNELEKRWGKFADSISVPCVTPDLSHLTPDQINKGIEDVINRTLDPGRPPAHVIGRSPSIGRTPEHILRPEQHTQGVAAKGNGGLHELPAGHLDGKGQLNRGVLPDALHGRLGDIQAGQDTDMRRPGTSPTGGGSKSERSLTRDNSKRAERKEYRAAARADLRQRFAQYTRFVRVGDIEHFKRMKEAKAERSQAISEIRAQSKAAKSAIPKHASETERLITNVEIDAESLRRKLQAESIFQDKTKSLRATRTPPLSWRAWLYEQSNLGDKAAISALRGIVYQAQRDAKYASEEEADDIEEEVDAEAYREQQYRKVMARLLEEEEEEVAIRSANRNTMRAYEIDALLIRYSSIQWRVTGNGNIEYSDQGGDHLFTDRGNRVTFDRVRVSDEEIRLALVHAQQKFGNQITLTGDNQAFTERMARIADDMGIAILNPEMRSVIENHRADRIRQDAKITAEAAATARAEREPVPEDRNQESLASSSSDTPSKTEILSAQDRLRAIVLSIDPRAEFVVPDPVTSDHSYIGPIAATLGDSGVGFAQQTGRSTYILHASNAPTHSAESVIEVRYTSGHAVTAIVQETIAPLEVKQKVQRTTTPKPAKSNIDSHQATPAPAPLRPEIPAVVPVAVAPSMLDQQAQRAAAPAAEIPAATPHEITTETPSISAHDWLKKWIEDTGKSIGTAVAENEDAAYTIVHIAPDGIVLDKGRTGAVYSTPADLVLQVGDKVVVNSEVQLRPSRIPQRGKDESELK